MQKNSQFLSGAVAPETVFPTINAAELYTLLDRRLAQRFGAPPLVAVIRAYRALAAESVSYERFELELEGRHWRMRSWDDLRFVVESSIDARRVSVARHGELMPPAVFVREAPGPRAAQPPQIPFHAAGVFA